MDKEITRVNRRTMELLMSYDWPGNVRELKNVVERMVIMGDERIVPRDIPRDLVTAGGAPSIPAGTNKTLREFRNDMEREYILFKLHELDWNVSKAAQVLGIERTNLHKKMKSLEIHRD